MTVADYANADPAVVKSGRVKKAVANAVEKEGKDYMEAHCIHWRKKNQNRHLSSSRKLRKSRDLA